MKSFTLFLFSTILYYCASAQCTTPLITASGPTTLCPGGSVILSAPVADTWTQRTDFGGTDRGLAVSFSIGSMGYLGTGTHNVAGVYYKDFWQYDPATGAWTQKADFAGTGRSGATGFSINGMGYIGTGSDGAGTQDFWQYNPMANMWNRRADFGGGSRYGAIGFSVGGKGYIGTGFDNSLNGTRDFWEYDPSADTWSKKADFGGEGRSFAASFSIGSNGYIGTGSYTKDFWEYKPSTNTWARKADFPGTGRSSATGFSIASRGYLGIGYDGSNTKDFWEYDPSSDIWIRQADFGDGERYSATGFGIGNKGYIGTGINNSSFYVKSFWEYTPGYTYVWGTGGATTSSINVTAAGTYGVTVTDVAGCTVKSGGIPVTISNPVAPVIAASGKTTFCQGGSVTLSVADSANTWTQKADFGGIARNLQVGFSIGNKGYAGTGSYQGNYKKDFWEYDPSANAWTQKADFGGAARDGAAGFSIGTKGYIGIGYNGNYLRDFWEYDPVDNTWIQKADFGGSAREDAPGFSIGSKGYVGTGEDGSLSYRDFWEYDPSTNTWAQKAGFAGTARSRATGFNIAGKGYIGLGFSGPGFAKDFWEYDPSIDMWTRKADFGGTARRATGFSIGNKGYAGTGYDGSYKKDFWEYDPSTNVWTQKADVGGVARINSIAFGIGSKGYIGMGSNQVASLINDFWEYNPGYNYLWAPGGATTSSINANTSGNYTVTTINTFGCSAASAPVTVTANSAPLITTQIKSAHICKGGTATFSVAATGSNLRYQWYKDSNTISNTSASITISNAQVSDAGYYSVVVYGDCGGTSTAAFLTVGAPAIPVITVINNCGSSTLSTTNTGSSLLWNTGETTSSITVTNPGLYYVTQYDLSTCYNQSDIVTVAPKAIPATPTVMVTDKCGRSTLSTTATGALLWSTGETASSITVITPGTYTVTQTINGCTSAQGSGDAAPKAIPSTPSVTVINNCGNSTLSTAATGTLLWSTGETTSSITVTTPGTYTVTQTINGCTSAQGSGDAAPKAVPSTPSVTVTNNCGSSTLSTTATGNLQWSTSETTSSIIVTTAGNYSVTQTVNGCTSAQGSGIASPKAIPSTPSVTVTNNCGSSTLSTTATGSLQWSTGETASSIIVKASGSYKVTVTNAGGCSSTSTAVTVTINNDTQKPVITCPAAVTLCYVAAETYTIDPLQATDNCGITGISYTISGATTRSGSGADASGKFTSGTSIITWTVKDAAANTSTCQATVIVKEKFTLTIPDGWALGSGCSLNTVYKGYLPASALLLTTRVSGGKSPYTYKWSNGATTSFILVNPATATTYTVTVKDAKGCTQVSAKLVNVADLRCGSKLDKVNVCNQGKALCADQKDVAGYLLHGAYLGNCKSSFARPGNAADEKVVSGQSDLNIKAFPNPGITYFTVIVKSSNLKDKVSISVTDELGRLMEIGTVNPGQTFQVGNSYRPGMYFGKAIQANKSVIIKLIKQ